MVDGFRQPARHSFSDGGKSKVCQKHYS